MHAGAVVAKGAVTSRVTHLVCEDRASTRGKAQQARSKGVAVVDEAFVRDEVQKAMDAKASVLVESLSPRFR